jgi:transporter family-2 protein
LVAVAVGVGVAVQVAILGRSSGKLHPLAISVGLQFAGLLVGTVWAVSQRAWPDVRTVFVQWWWIPVGALGWLLVAALGFASHRIGVAPTLGLAVSSQLLVGFVIDVRGGVATLGLRPVAGAAFLIAGLILITGRP